MFDYFDNGLTWRDVIGDDLIFMTQHEILMLIYYEEIDLGLREPDYWDLHPDEEREAEIATIEMEDPYMWEEEPEDMERYL